MLRSRNVIHTGPASFFMYDTYSSVGNYSCTKEKGTTFWIILVYMICQQIVFWQHHLLKAKAHLLAQLDIFTYSKWLNIIWSIDGTLTSQSGPEINGNERVLHIPKTSGLKPRHHMQSSVISSKWLNIIWSIDGTLTSQSGPEINGNERVLHIPKTSGLKPRHHMQSSVISRTLVRGCLTPLKGCSQHIVLLQPAGLHITVCKQINK